MADTCVNDLEAPAFAVMPELEQLKARVAAEGHFDAVFMTGALRAACVPGTYVSCLSGACNCTVLSNAVA